MELKEQGGGGGFFSVYLYNSIPYDPGCVLRIQCPAILASVVTLLGAVLSFTFVPATTKEASVQSARQGKPTCPQTGPMGTTLPKKPASCYWGWREDLLDKGFKGLKEGMGSPLDFLLQIPGRTSWASLQDSGKPRP